MLAEEGVQLGHRRADELRLVIHVDVRGAVDNIEFLRLLGLLVDLLAPEERKTWAEAVSAYASDLSKKDIVFDEPLPRITKALAKAVDLQVTHPCWEREVDPHLEVLGAWAERVHAHGIGIICWHEERPEVIAGLRRSGVDGICSDRPELLVDQSSY